MHLYILTTSEGTISDIWGVTQKSPKLECHKKTVCSTAMPFMNHSAKQRSAVQKCVFFCAFLWRHVSAALRSYRPAKMTDVKELYQCRRGLLRRKWRRIEISVSDYATSEEFRELWVAPRTAAICQFVKTIHSHGNSVRTTLYTKSVKMSYYVYIHCFKRHLHINYPRCVTHRPYSFYFK
jgi:hypothetical protein